MTIDESCPAVEFPVSWETFRRLPRHPGYRYEYRDGVACLRPHPRQYHCLLPLQPRDAATMIETPRTHIRIRPLCESDWLPLEAVFDRAFRGTALQETSPPGEPPPGEPPPGRTADCAVSDPLHRACAGQSGPLVRPACFVATAARPEETDDLVGGILITLLPAGDLERFDDPVWSEQPPPDAVDRCWGRPHLTWVFVDPPLARRGVASLMLTHAAGVLHDLGYREFASTFLLGNEQSTLWHWRNGFRLASYVGSSRAREQRDAATVSRDRVS